MIASCKLKRVATKLSNKSLDDMVQESESIIQEKQKLPAFFDKDLIEVQPIMSGVAGSNRHLPGLRHGQGNVV